MDIMETPLLGQNSDLLGNTTSSVFNEFQLWEEAQAVSVKSALQYSSFVNLVHPLENLQKKATLDKFWDRLNAVCTIEIILP